MTTRDRYIDFLRALALIRVITYHTFDWVWLPAAFPSLGIMFALGGALVASSLDRAGSTRVFLRKRLRRLLPPFWVFGAAMLAIMLALGWQVDAESGGVELSWSNVWLWVFPLADPPASSAGYLWVLPMWYIRAYLWFLLLSPALLWLFRRWPLRLLAVPAVVLPLLTLGLFDLPDPYWDIVCITCMYAACWLLGFAHHDGKLRRLPLAPTLLAGMGLMALGLWHALSHQEQYGSWNVDDNPVAGMLYFTGAVLILLRIYVSFDWLQRLPTLDAFVSLLNNRAMTIYLWGNFAIAMAPLVLERTPLAQFDTDDARGQALQYASAWTLVFVAVLLLGWVEDVAAARRPRLLPWHRVSHRRTAAAAAEPDTVRPDDATAPAMAGSVASGATAVGSLAGPAATAPTKAPASPAAGAGGAVVPPEADGSESGPAPTEVPTQGPAEVPDQGPADQGPADEGPTDEGPTDEGPTDEGPTDEGPTDEGPTDQGPTDEGPTHGNSAEAEPAPGGTSRRMPESAQA